MFRNFATPMTQEAIAIVVLFALIIVYIVLLVRLENEPPFAVGVAGIAVSLFLVVTVGRAVMMPTKPIADVIVAIFIMFGGACALGLATMAAIEALVDKRDGKAEATMAAIEALMDKRDGKAEAVAVPDRSLLVVAGASIHALTAIIGLVFMQLSISAAAAAKSTGTQYGFDPTSPTSSLSRTAAAMPFTGDSLPFSIAALVFAAAAIGLAVVGKKSGAWKALGIVCAICVAVSLACVLIVGFQTGMFFSISF